MFCSIICMNDGMIEVMASESLSEVAVIEIAQARLEELARKHYISCKWNYKSYEDYRHVVYWHLHNEVRLVKV